MKDYTEFVNRLFESREQAHVFHLQTKSHAEHMALDDYYKDIVEFIDTLIEVYQGQYSIIGDYQTIKASDYDKSDVIKYFQELVQWIRDEKLNYIKEEDTHLLNIVDEVCAFIYKTLYKLRFLK